MRLTTLATAAAAVVSASFSAAAAADGSCTAGEGCAAVHDETRQRSTSSIAGLSRDDLDVVGVSLLQHKKHEQPHRRPKPSPVRPRVPQADQTYRVRIVDKTLVMAGDGGDFEVVLLGGNYVVKAQPYFPPEEVIRANAKSMFEGTQAMHYKPDGKKVLPVVRLGCMMEGAMPHGPQFDPKWVANLKKAVQIFAEEGVYVVLDSHSDTWSSTNGGEGFPWWMMKYMQDTHPDHAYTVSPKHPLRTVIPSIFTSLLNEVGAGLPVVRVVNDTNPWFNYSVEDKEPWKMNVGNLNVRENNDDAQWSNGVLVLSQQSNNIARRFYKSWKTEGRWASAHPDDREQVFQPFVEYLKFLAEVWQDNPNVVAIEMLNEPPIAGLPNIPKAVLGRRELFSMYHAVLEELDAVPAVYAFQDLLGSVEGAAPIDIALGIAPLPHDSLVKIKDRARKGQLMYAIHYYPGMGSVLSFDDHIKKAQSTEFGKIMPIFLSEFWHESAQECANLLRHASELDVSITTYWHYVDSNFTGNDGWYKYPADIEAVGVQKAWGDYSKTVQDGTYWGAQITGSGGGKSNILARVHPADRSH